MKAAEDQVVEDDASFQDDEVKYDCLQNIFSFLEFLHLLVSLFFSIPEQESFFQDIDLLQKHGIVSEHQDATDGSMKPC